MTKLRYELDRRNLLRFLANGAVALPFMRTLLESEAFGATAAKRALFFYYPDGAIKADFHPREIGSNFKLPIITAPLEAVRSDVIMLKGIRYIRSKDYFGDPHEEGAGVALSGVPDRLGGVSLDTYLGAKLKDGVSVGTLRLGVGSNYLADYKRTISFLDNKLTPSPIEDNPTKAFEAMFGAVDPSRMNPRAALSAKLQISALDHSLEAIKGLKAALGTIEAQKLELHIEAVRELERRVQLSSTSEGMAVCGKKNASAMNFPVSDTANPTLAQKYEYFDVVLDLMTDIMVQAFACGLTRVGYLQLAAPVASTSFAFPNGPSVPSGKTHHDFSHHGIDPAYSQYYSRCQTYCMQKLTQLIQKLKATAEGDKTLLYNTALMAFSEIGDGNVHDHDNMGLILAGQA
ncbi:MAG: DUF1552 domain-containing protein, partial [Proteobacteria bacterium]